jgi:thiamine-phosphate pyrophosphorylase
MKPLADCRLYAFIDTAYFHGRAPEVFAQQLCDGGADLIQLRAKKSTPARETGTEFCHLGQEDFFDAGHMHVSEVRNAKCEVRIGLSTHSPEQAQRALAAEPDYIAIGPVYATGTKPMAKPVTLEYVRWAAVNVNIPWFAIGGINLRTLDEVLAAGAKRICVVSAILNATDVMKACLKFRQRLV